MRIARFQVTSPNFRIVLYTNGRATNRKFRESDITRVTQTFHFVIFFSFVLL